VGIIKTVRSVLNNDYRNIEIIVVNDGSTDNSHDIFTAFHKNEDHWRKIHPHATMQYFYKDNGGKGTALNHGIAAAKGEIVVTVDADSVLDSKALSRLVPYFEDPTIDAAVGAVRIANKPSILGLIQNLEYIFGFYFKRSHSVLNAEYIFGGACAAFRRHKTFAVHGLFDEAHCAEDIEMSMRLRFEGLHSVYAEDVVCFTEGANSVTGLINQRLRWKKGRFNTLLRYRDIFFSREKHHNKFLAWFIMPYALLSELHMLFEPFGLALLVTYSVISGEYLSLAVSSLFILIIYLVNALFSRDPRAVFLALLFPFTWPLFYFLVWIEWLALMKSMGLFIRGREVTWQSWKRQGIRTFKDLEDSSATV